MTAARVEDLADFVSLEDAAARLGCSLDHIEMMAVARRLAVIRQQRPEAWGGDMRLVIERGELERVAALIGQPTKPTEHPERVKSALWFLGLMLTIWTGEDERLLEHPYELRDFIANDALHSLEIAPTGTDKQRNLLRSRETDAELIAEALHIFRESGLYRPPKMRAADEAVKRAREAQAKVQQMPQEAPQGEVAARRLPH